LEVIAFVGESGTGKSHRASLIALQHNVDLIIDDGLLIQDSRILVGESAKREQTRIGAVKRAIFAEPAEALAARAALAAVSPKRVLVLGTSEAMINRITDTLGLPPANQLISIQEVASPAQIRRARRARRESGKHVIPAPTVEVKKTFSGYLIDPLKVFFRTRAGVDPEREIAIEKSVVRPTFSSLGRFFIDDVVLLSIAARAAREVEGITRIYRVRTDVERDGVRINVEVAVRYRLHVVDTLTEGQRVVKERVEHMTALNVLCVDMLARGMTVD
jgi:uncharacterized alkaline shock family protein YloU